MKLINPEKASIYRERNAQIQGAIERIAQNFEQLGMWIADVKKRELYRYDAEHPDQTYEQWCQRVLGFSRRRANQITNSSEASKAISDIFERNGLEAPPISERAAREYAKVEPEQAAEDIRNTQQEGKKPTAKEARQARERREKTPVPAVINEERPTPPRQPVQQTFRFTYEFEADAQEDAQWFAKISPDERTRIIRMARYTANGAPADLTAHHTTPWPSPNPSTTAIATANPRPAS